MEIFKLKKKEPTCIYMYKLNDYLQCDIKARALNVIEENEGNFTDANLKLKGFYQNIYWERTHIDDLLNFCDEYGVTLDYMLGRTETPYYTM